MQKKFNGSRKDYSKIIGVSVIALFMLMTVMSAVVLFATPAGAGSGGSCPSGIISYWKLDDGAGTTAIDSCGTNNGTLMNGPAWTIGRVNGALDFEEISSQYVEIPDDPSLDITDAITVEAWVKLESKTGNNMKIVQKEVDGGHSNPWQVYALLLEGGADAFGFHISDGTSGSLQTVTGTTNPILGMWYHVVGTYDGSGPTLKIYVNGVEENSNTPSISSLGTTDEPLRIGKDGGAEYWDGLIDEVAIYNEALSDLEISKHYQRGLFGHGYCVPPNTCLIPDALGDTQDYCTCNGDLQAIFNDYEFSYGGPDLSTITVTGDQTHYQIWDFYDCVSSVTLEFEYVGREAGNTNVFGYYVNNSGTIVFTPLFENIGNHGSHPSYTGLLDVNPRYEVTHTIQENTADYLGFGIDSYNGSAGIQFYTENRSNPVFQGEHEDHALVFEMPEEEMEFDSLAEYVVCFEDLAFGNIDCQNNPNTPDFDDVVVIVRVKNCNTYDTIKWRQEPDLEPTGLDVDATAYITQITDDNTNWGSRDNEVVAFSPSGLTLDDLFAGAGLSYTYTIIDGGLYDGASPIVAVIDLADGRHIILFPGWGNRADGTSYTLQYSETVAHDTGGNSYVDFSLQPNDFSSWLYGSGPTYGDFEFVKGDTSLIDGTEVVTRVAIQHQAANTGETDKLDSLTFDGTTYNFAPQILADDFECTMTEPITDIHVWGSWFDDYLPFDCDPMAVAFTLSIHSDIPDPDPGNPQTWSMPGDVLWYKTFSPGEFDVSIYADQLEEGWYTPCQQCYTSDGDTVCWKYDFYIDPEEAFIQGGTPENPVVYWLDVQARPLDQQARFGWKTSLDHWNDDATWAVGEEPYQGQWEELRYPGGHPLQCESIDLAFMVTSTTPPEINKTVGEPSVLEDGGITFTTAGDGTAGWSKDVSYSGVNSIKMTTPSTTSDQGRAILDYHDILGNIASFSYESYTVNAGLADQLSIWVSFYLDEDDDGNWDYYLQGEPYYTYGYPTLNTWEHFDVMNMKFSNYERPTGYSNDCPHSAPTLQDYIDGTAMTAPCPCGSGCSTPWASREYGSLKVLHIDMRAGYGGPWPGFIGYIDDIEINGDVITGDDWWVTTETEICASASDGSGEYDVYYKVWNVTAGQDENTYGWTWWFDETTPCVPYMFNGTCEHVFAIKAVDCSGNINYHNETFYVDETGPNQTIELGTPKQVGAIGNFDRIGKNTPIWLNSTDEGCNGGVGTEKLTYKVYYGYDHQHMSLVKGPIVVEDNDDNDTDNTEGRISVVLYMDETCYHQIDTLCYDLLGNENYSKLDFIVDADGPTVDKDIGWPQCGEFVNFSTKIWLNATDPVPSNPDCACGEIAKICWNITVNAETSSYCEDGDKANFAFTEECNHTLEFWAVDILGNEGLHTIQTHYVDDTPPTTVKEYGTPQCGCGTLYITSQTPIYLNATDGGLCKVGGMTIYYRVWYNGTWTSWMNSAQNVTRTMEQLGLPWDDDCVHYIEYYAVDCLGNTEELHNQTFYVDNTGPKVDKEFSQPNYGPDGLFVTTDTIIYLNATDLIGECASGVKEIHYNITKPDQTYEYVIFTGDKTSFSFEENCTHGLEFWAVDCLGNEGEHTEQTHYVDEEVPVDEWEYLPAATTYYDTEEGERYIGNRTIKRVNATDRGCNVGGAGVCRIEWRVTDDNPFNNIAKGRVYDNDSCIYDIYNANVIVTGDNDLTVGVISIDISINEDCQHYIFYTLIDCLGNAAPEVKQPVRVDSQPPEITKTHPTHGWYPINDTHSYLKCGVEINFTAIDLPQGICKSGLQAMYWRYEWNTQEFGDIDGQYLADLYAIDDDPAISDHDWYLYTGNFTFSEECKHDLYYWAVDNVANYGPVHHQVYFVDNTPPTVHIDFPTHGYVPIAESDNSGYLKCNTNITLNATDWPEPPCQAGLESIFYRYEWNGTEYPEPEGCVWGEDLGDAYGYTDPEILYHWWYRFDGVNLVDISFEEECIHDLYYWAKDNVCNRSEIYHHVFYVDNTPPDIEIIHPEDHGYVPINETAGYLKIFTNITLKADEVAGSSYDPSTRSQEVLDAIDDGLAYLASQQNPTTGKVGTYYSASQTAFAVLKWAEHATRFNHTDPFDPDYQYSSNIEKGLDYMFNYFYTTSIIPQAAGDPDSNGNGLGVYVDSPEGSVNHGYETPIGLMAIVVTEHPERIVTTGALAGWTYEQVAQDMVDWIAYAQQDTGTYRGGWRYSANGGADNSVSQWPVLGLMEAEQWGISPPSWVKDELLIWLAYSQNANGGFGYTGPSGTDIDSTAAGIVQLTYCGKTTADQEVQDAIGYIGTYWTAGGQEHFGYMYSLYAVMKAAMTAQPNIITHFGTHDWGTEYDDYLLLHQNGDGSWSDEYGSILGTEWALLILQRIAPQFSERCASGVESIFWRYEFGGDSYPLTLVDDEYDVVDGMTLHQTYGYTDEKITDFLWYRVNESEVDFDFEEQCIHDLYYWTKDNVCNRGEIYYHRYHVDDTPPVVTRATGQPNCTVEGKTFVRTTTPIWINATDEGICQAGVESIFFRYEWNDSGVINLFPPGCNGYMFDVVDGTTLTQLYGYTDEDITNYMWYRIDGDTVMFSFPEECIHTLYYWAKDDVSNRGEIYNHTYYVDDTPPYSDKTFDGPVYNASQEDIDKFNLETDNEINNFWLRDNHTWVILNATDREAPCDVGITYLHVELWWDSNGDDVIDTLLWTRVIYDQDEVPYYDSNRSIGGIQYKFQIMEDCLHEIRWYTVDCLGNTETMTPQHVNFNLFYDDFETDLSKWTTSCFASRKNDSYSIDNYYVELRSKGIWHGWMLTTVDTTGYENIKLSYHARTRDAEQNDELKVAYKIGTGSWNPLNQINNDEWQVYTHDLVGAENEPVVKIKFRMDCNDWDYGLVDNVIVTGTKETDMHVQQHRVDSTPPQIVKIVGEPSDYWGTDQYGHDIWDVTADTEINLDQTYDQEDPCAVGVESIKYKIWFLGNWTEWIDYTENITFSEHCTHYLLVNATDYLGNYALDNETFIVHAEVGEHPTLISPIDGALLNYSEITFEWNPVIGRDNYRVEWSTDVHFETFEYANVTGSQHTVILPDGTYYWHVAIIYTGGTIGQWSDTWSFTIDTTEPVISDIDSNDDDDVVIAGTTLVLTVVEDNAESGLSGTITITGTTSGVVVDAQGLIDNLDGTYYYEYPIPEDEIAEQYTVTATLEDAFGNKDDDGFPTYTYTVIPTAGPIIENLVADPDEVSSEDVTITATASNTESIIEAAEYFINTIGTSGLGTPMSASDGTFDSTTEDITALVDNEDLDEGVNRIYVHAKDEAQNWGSFEQVIVVKDSVAPEIDDIYSNDDDDVVIAGTTLVLTVVEDNAESGLSGTITITGTTSGVVVDAQGLIDNLDGTYYYEYPIPEDEIAEQYTVTATLEDAFGNKDDDGFPTYTYTVLSTSGPTSHILDIDPYSTSDDPTLIAEITSDEAQIAYAECKIDLDGDVVELLSEGLYGTYEYIEQVITLPGDITEGTHVLFMRARDENGNWGAWDEEEFVFYIEDTTPPGPVEMLMHLDDGLGEYEYDADGDITVVWTKATDDKSGVEYYEFEVELDEEPYMTYLIPDDGLPNDYATFAINDLPEGEFTGRVRAVDYAGYEGPWSSWHTVIVDKTAPVLWITDPESTSIVRGVVSIEFDDSEITNPMISIDGMPYEPTTNDDTHLWDTTELMDAQHFLMIKDTDLAGHTGYSQYGYWLFTNNHDEDEPDVHIVNPIEGTTHSGTVTIQVEAEDDLTPPELLRVKVLIHRQDYYKINDPDFSYIASYDGEQYFTVDLDISKYTDGTHLMIHAFATDEANKTGIAEPVEFVVESGIEFDQWMHDDGSWNSLEIPPDVLPCSYLVEDVLASIDGKYDWIYHYDESEDWWYTWNRTRNPLANDLVELDSGERYSIYMQEAGRVYIDTDNPIITIEYPEDVACFGGFEEDIWGTAYDATPYEVVITIYDPEAGDDGEYWDGEDWTPDYTELSCELDDGEWYYGDTDEVDWESRNGHTIEITATITDMHSCQDSDMVSFIYDNQPPYVEILDPEDGQERTEGPGDMNFIVEEDETVLTAVNVSIYNETDDEYYNGSGWQDGEIWLLCSPDEGNQWYYITDGIWLDGVPKTYVISVEAYDCPGNRGLDINTFYIVEPEPDIEIIKSVWDVDQWDDDTDADIGDTVSFMLSIENVGNCELYDLNITDYLPPCLEYKVEDGWTFDGPNPEDVTFTQWGEENEILSWEVDTSEESMPPDAEGHIFFNATVIDFGDNINWANFTAWYECQQVYYEDDATVHVPYNPNIEITKTVWNETLGDWDEYVAVPNGSVVTFNITIHNSGNCELYDVYLVDELPPCLNYTVGNVSIYGYYDPEMEPDITYDWESTGITLLEWGSDGEPLPPGIIFSIELNVTVVSCGLDNENYVYIWADSDGGDVETDDTATVYGICEEPCMPEIELTKKVWCDTYGWVDEIGAINEETVRFNLSIHNNGECCDLSDISVVDYLPSELTYAGDMTVVYDSGITGHDFEQADNDDLWWNFTGSLPYCHWIYIEFNATVDFGEVPSCSADNWAQAEGWCNDYMDYMLDGATVFNWACS